MNENEPVGTPDENESTAAQDATMGAIEAPVNEVPAYVSVQAPPAMPTYPAPAAEIPTATASPAFTKPPRKRGRLVAIIAGASIIAIGSAGGGVAAGVTIANYHATTTASAPSTTTQDNGTTTQGGQGTFGGNGFSQGSTGGTGGSTTQGGTGGTTTQDGTSSGTASTATDEQQTGVVLINTELKYLGGEAAGTGIVLTSSGEILTNNHVVEGSTSITVTIASTGKEYTATVVGTDPTDDIAVLQLEDASGLATADLDTSGSVAVGDTVTGVGNAEGQGFLSAAAGSVTALDQQISVADDVTGASKTLSGLIETNAGIVSGDSGGPLLDSDGEVVGIDTAASANTQVSEGYAIPIANALKIVEQIEAGDESGSVTLGYPAFFGVELPTTATTTTDGAVISGVIDDTPAATAGLAAGDTITKVGSTVITTGDKLSTTIAGYNPGDKVSVTYTTAAGTTKTVTVTLVEGPAK